MLAELQAEFQAIADKGNTFSVTISVPEVAAVPATTETVEFAPTPAPAQ